MSSVIVQCEKGRFLLAPSVTRYQVAFPGGSSAVCVVFKFSCVRGSTHCTPALLLLLFNRSDLVWYISCCVACLSSRLQSCPGFSQ
jgi:hypothetical protein